MTRLPAMTSIGALAAVFIALPAAAQITEAPQTNSEISQEPSAAAIQGDPFGDIVVTARRREETSQSVPIALTAISGAQLKARNSLSLQQIQQQLPSLKISAINPNNTNVNIRGLGANALFSNIGLENGVRIHVDGVYLSRPGQSTFELVDLDRIEALRGPQGTLFGKYTTAGAINIITWAPSFKPEMTVEGTIASHETYRLRTSVSGALTNTVAARLSLSHSAHGVYIQNSNFGPDNDGENNAIRAQLLFNPSDTFGYA